MPKNKALHLVLITSIVFFATSCAKIFMSPDAKELASTHKLLAVIPPKVSIAAYKKVDADSLIKQQKAESINFQNKMYSWLLKRKKQGMITQEIQKLETTNAMLKNVGYPEKPMTSAELCTLLNVDGILTSNYSLAKQTPEGVAIVLELFAGFGTATNRIHVTLAISDCSNKKLIWNYDQNLSDGIGSNPGQIVNDLMRIVTRKLPYRD